MRAQCVNMFVKIESEIGWGGGLKFFFIVRSDWEKVG